MTNDSGKKPQEIWMLVLDNGDRIFRDFKPLKEDVFVHGITNERHHVVSKHYMVESTSCANCERLEDQLYHESRRADEVAYLKDGEIKKLQNQLYKTEESSANEYQKVQKLQSKLDKACEALERVKHNGCCIVCSSVCPACNAHKALAEIRKKDE